MKMPDGGFRPAYNVELATDGDHGVIVGVGVTTAGTDAGQAAPMEEQVEERTGQRPHSYLMDGLCHQGRHHHPGAKGCEGVRAGKAAAEQAGGGTVSAPIRGWGGGGSVA